MSDREDPGRLVPAPFEPSRASRLAAFLDHPRRPPETLSYHGLQGFLFAIATGPVLVDPSEWPTRGTGLLRRRAGALISRQLNHRCRFGL